MRKFHKVSFSEPIAKVMPSTVYLEAEFEYKGKIIPTQASGWLWKKNLIISCHHCVYQPGYTLSKVWVKFYDERIRSARVRFVDPQFDIATLELEEPVDAPVAKYILNDDTKVGDVVIMLASAAGFPHSPQTGILCRRRRYIPLGESKDDYSGHLQIDCLTIGGASGGLVINQSGIGIGMMQKAQGPFGFALPLGVIMNIIARSIIFGKQYRKTREIVFYKSYGVKPIDEIDDGRYKNFYEQKHVSEASVNRNRSTIIVPAGSFGEEGLAAFRNVLLEINEEASRIFRQNQQHVEPSEHLTGLSDDVGAGFISGSGHSSQQVPGSDLNADRLGEAPLQDEVGSMALSKVIRADQKKFFFDFGSNNRGHFLRIFEVAGPHRSSIILPLSELKQFHKTSGHFLEIMDMPEGMTGTNVRTVLPIKGSLNDK